MVRKIEIAERIVAAQRQKQPDLVAAWISGSVARGEDTEASDIDLMLAIAGEIDGDVLGYPRTVDGWYEGVYVEAISVSVQQYSDLMEVMNNPFKVTQLNDALILYDATGQLTRLQEEVRAIYMQPEWLQRRLQYWLDSARKLVNALPEATASDQPLALAKCPGAFALSLIAILLLRDGITPSSTRGLLQVGMVDPTMKERLVDFLGAAHLYPNDLAKVASVAHSLGRLVEDAGHLPEYFGKKAFWLAHNGFHQEAIYPLWHTVTQSIWACEQNAALAAQATPLILQWLEGVGWQGADVLDAKVEEAQALLEYAEELVTAVRSV